MANGDDPALSELLDRLSIADDERARFFVRDTASTLANVQLLTAAAFSFNAHGVEEF